MIGDGGCASRAPHASAAHETAARDAANAPRPAAANGPRPDAANGPRPDPANGPRPDAANAPRPDAANGPRPDPATGPRPAAANGPRPDAANGPRPDAANGPRPGAATHRRRLSGALATRTAVLTLAAALAAPAPAAAQTITNVSASFRGGPYTTISVDLADPNRVAVGTADGHVSITTDAGGTSRESLVVVGRKFDPVTIRSGARAEFSVGSGTALSAELSEDFDTGDREEPQSGGARGGGRGRRASEDQRATLLFLSLLAAGMPAARFQAWMALADPVTDLADVAMPRGDGPLVAVAQAGVLISDQSWASWSRTLGAPGPMPRERDLIGLSAAIDPLDARHILAGTDRGLMVSVDGGYNFSLHPDRDFEDSWVTRLVWDPENPQLVFAVTPDSILLSQDGGRTFDPSFAAEGEIKDLSLSAEAAVVATSEGVQVATSEGITTLAEKKDFVGAVAWRGGAFLAATSEELLLLTPDGRSKSLLRTSSTDPFLRLVGDHRMAWLLSTHAVLRIGEPVARGRGLGGRPPRMLVSMEAMERALLKHTGLGGPEDTRLHNRWQAKLLPRVSATVRSTLATSGYRLADSVLLPTADRTVQAQASDNLHLEVWAAWDLSEILFSDSHVSNPNLVIEQNIRDKRTAVIEQARWHFRECAALARDLARPPSDPEVELAWRMRLEEHASYLQFMTGQRVVELSEVENLSPE